MKRTIMTVGILSLALLSGQLFAADAPKAAPAAKIATSAEQQCKADATKEKVSQANMPGYLKTCMDKQTKAKK